MITLTKQERSVLIALGFIFLIGTCIHYACQKSPQITRFVNLMDSERVYYKINLNRASVEDLVRVPYIGELTARKIVEFRERNGPFQRIEDIQQVDGIRAKNFERFRRHLKVK
jgi:competence protein ComEA